MSSTPPKRPSIRELTEHAEAIVDHEREKLERADAAERAAELERIRAHADRLAAYNAEKVPFTVRLHPSVVRYLAIITPDASVVSVLEHLAASAADGVGRPGSWERPWLVSAFGSEWTMLVEPDPECSWRVRPRSADDAPCCAEWFAGSGEHSDECVRNSTAIPIDGYDPE
jgi:hypothetical protein